MSEKSAKTWGAVTILTTGLTGVISTAVIYIFTQSLNVAPLAESFDNMAKQMEERDRKTEIRDKKADKRDQELMAMIYNQTARMTANEVKLKRVIDDCEENEIALEACQKKVYSLPLFQYNIKDN